MSERCAIVATTAAVRGRPRHVDARAVAQTKAACAARGIRGSVGRCVDERRALFEAAVELSCWLLARDALAAIAGESSLVAEHADRAALIADGLAARGRREAARRQEHPQLVRDVGNEPRLSVVDERLREAAAHQRPFDANRNGSIASRPRARDEREAASERRRCLERQRSNEACIVASRRFVLVGPHCHGQRRVERSVGAEQHLDRSCWSDARHGSDAQQDGRVRRAQRLILPHGARLPQLVI